MAEEKDIGESKLDIQQIRSQLEQLEQEKLQMAMMEIQAILDKYGAELYGYAIVPVTKIQIVPKRI